MSNEETRGSVIIDLHSVEFALENGRTWSQEIEAATSSAEIEALVKVVIHKSFTAGSEAMKMALIQVVAEHKI